MAHIRLVISALSLLALMQPAWADEPLPGVSVGHSIVKPEPAEPEPLATADDGSIMVGNTRVKISGSVTVDIGVGATKPPRR